LPARAERNVLYDVLAQSALRAVRFTSLPRGKRELPRNAIRWTSEQILAHMQASTASTAVGVLRHFVALFQHVAEASDGAPAARSPE